MKKSKTKIPGTPTQAILTPAAKDAKTGMTIPGVENVRRAKEFVDENKK